MIRGKPGNAQVYVTLPNGFERVLTFEAEKVTADGGAAVKASKSGGLWLIDVNDYEHYVLSATLFSPLFPSLNNLQFPDFAPIFFPPDAKSYS